MRIEFLRHERKQGVIGFKLRIEFNLSLVLNLSHRCKPKACPVSMLYHRCNLGIAFFKPLRHGHRASDTCVRVTRGWGKHIITASHLNLHHTKFKGNYGLYFRFWDKVCGTDVGLVAPVTVSYTHLTLPTILLV